MGPNPDLAPTLRHGYNGQGAIAILRLYWLP
jgi:hypothetical protein